MKNLTFNTGTSSMPGGVPTETLEPSHKEILCFRLRPSRPRRRPVGRCGCQRRRGDMRRGLGLGRCSGRAAAADSAVTPSCRDLTAMGARAARSSLALLTPSTGRDLRAFSDADVLGQDFAAVTLDAAAE